MSARQDEMDAYSQECEMCNDWFDERNMTEVNVWYSDVADGVYALANNAEGTDVMVCITCEARF